MFISNITNRGAMPALVKTLAFNEARFRVIAENLANSETPRYRTKHVDPKAFQAALRKALQSHDGDSTKPFVVTGGHEVRTDPSGFLEVTPTEKPAENILFHDGTNMSIERQMAALAETDMMHEITATLLRGRFEGLRKAIRGRSS